MCPCAPRNSNANRKLTIMYAPDGSSWAVDVSRDGAGQGVEGLGPRIALGDVGRIIDPDAATTKRVLQDPIVIRYMQGFSKEEHNEENIEFWRDVERWRGLRRQAMGIVDNIYDRFIKTDADLEINIDHHMKEAVSQAVSGKDDVPCTVFDAAHAEVTSLIGEDIWPRFRKSKFYKSLLREKELQEKTGGSAVMMETSFASKAR